MSGNQTSEMASFHPRDIAAKTVATWHPSRDTKKTTSAGTPIEMDIRVSTLSLLGSGRDRALGKQFTRATEMLGTKKKTSQATVQKAFRLPLILIAGLGR
jgi:hypothetical protein